MVCPELDDSATETGRDAREFDETGLNVSCVIVESLFLQVAFASFPARQPLPIGMEIPVDSPGKTAGSIFCEIDGIAGDTLASRTEGPCSLGITPLPLVDL